MRPLRRLGPTGFVPLTLEVIQLTNQDDLHALTPRMWQPAT
jgi:hypothetical protein